MVECPTDIDERLEIARPLLSQSNPRLTEKEIIKILEWTEGQLTLIRRLKKKEWYEVRGPRGQAGRIRHRRTRSQQ